MSYKDRFFKVRGIVQLNAKMVELFNQRRNGIILMEEFEGRKNKSQKYAPKSKQANRGEAFIVFDQVSVRVKSHIV